MKLVRSALFNIVSLLVVIAIYGYFFLSPYYKVERSIVIEASPKEVFSQIGDLRKWTQWAIWWERDPNMQSTFSANSTGVGASHEWESDIEGNGTLIIIESEKAEKLAYSLEFPDFELPITGTFTLTAEGDNTLVNWSDQGEMGDNPFMRYFVFFLDGMIGPDFEQGLGNLKRVVESQK